MNAAGSFLHSRYVQFIVDCTALQQYRYRVCTAPLTAVLQIDWAAVHISGTVGVLAASKNNRELSRVACPH